MNKIILKILMILIPLSFLKCQKDNEEIFHPVEISYEIKNVSEFGNNDGAINLTVSGGVLPFTFLWSNNETTEDIDSLPAGVYSVIVTDSRNNIESDTFNITQPAPIPIIVEFEITNPSETNASDGIINTAISGGYPPFIFSWSNGFSTGHINNLTAGEYILTIEDSKGQTLTDSISIIDCIIDIDGNIYATVKIGDQIWMKENLRVTHDPDGSSIESYVYRNDTTYEEIYGRLYTWNAAMNGSTEEKTQGICPCEWHIPSDEEFKILEIHLGMTRQEADLTNTWRGATVGTQLIYGGISGYDARLSGRRSSNGSYSLLGRMEYMWTSNEYGNNAWRRCLDIYANNAGRWNTFPKTYGFSIRCIKNE